MGVYCVFRFIMPPVHHFDPLSGSRAKLRRANRHLGALKVAIKRFVDSEPYNSRGSIDLDGDISYYVLRAQVRKEIPTSFPLIIGDICNKFRSALEHSIWGMPSALILSLMRMSISPSSTTPTTSNVAEKNTSGDPAIFNGQSSRGCNPT